MESLEKQLISAFATAWNEATPSLLKNPSSLSLLALREVTGDGVNSALAVAATWSSAFAVTCSGDLPGIAICLFKSEEGEQLDRLSQQKADSKPQAGARGLVAEVFNKTTTQLASEFSANVNFNEAVFVDLTIDESRLPSIVGGSVWVGTFAFTLEGENTQALLLYAPEGSLDNATKPSQTFVAKPTSASAQQRTAGPTPTPTRRSQRREESQVKNIERLLDVELEVVVRFGVTSMPLRDVVQMGTGSMLELNRVIDAPVEILVNGRMLARGDVVVIDGYYGVRITQIGTPNERAASMF
jgi:flagellar motor switch protein FliN